MVARTDGLAPDAAEVPGAANATDAADNPGAADAASRAGALAASPIADHTASRAGALAARIGTAIRVSLTSSITFATVGTAATSLLLIPLLSVLFDVLLGSDLASPDLVRIGYAAALVSLMVSVCSGVVAAVARDRMLGVFQEVQLRRRFDAAYWVSVAAVPVVLALASAVIVFGSVFAFSGGDGAMLGRAARLVLPALAVGLCLGIFAAGSGVGLPDPYLGATLVGALLPLTAGVIVPVSQYPAWFAGLVRFIPGTNTVRALSEATGAPGQLAFVGIDAALSLVWAGIGLALTRVAVAHLRNGVRLESI
ncbi:MAG: ABC transporter permease [Actinomycetaceae bacterium]|nr:ABC transporter permease [Actinomycetaceae bacterium]